MPLHWNGVTAFGTKDEAETVISVLRPAFARRPTAAISRARSAIASTSSSVSVGRPIMK